MTTSWVVSPDVVSALLFREWRVFRHVWWSVAFGSLLEPLIYFVAFGYGYGALVSRLAGLSYLEFIATGTIAIGVLFSSIFPAFITGYVRRKVQHLYDGILSAPVSVAELVTAESLWNGLRVTAVALITAGVAAVFGVRFGVGVMLVPVIALVSGFGFACAGAAFGALMRSTHQFDFVIVGVIVPMFVCAGTFFPIDNLPAVLVFVARINPLYHCVEVLRAAAFGAGDPATTLLHVVVVLGFDLVAWATAVLLVKNALID
jgi:lipooligosaccharide transport system permease protein